MNQEQEDLLILTDVEDEEVTDEELLNYQESLPERNEALMLLLHEWLEDESGYEEATWPIIKQLIEENALSNRRRFSD
jgi:hypothetical protein